MDIFSLHMNTTYTLHVYHIHYMYYDLPMIICIATGALPRPEVGQPELTIYGCACCSRGVLCDCEHKHTYTGYKLNNESLHVHVYCALILGGMMAITWYSRLRNLDLTAACQRYT